MADLLARLREMGIIELGIEPVVVKFSPAGKEARRAYIRDELARDLGIKEHDEFLCRTYMDENGRRFAIIYKEEKEERKET